MVCIGMPENQKSLSSSFDPTEWAEKRRQAMAKASELRDQRRRKAAADPVVQQRNPSPVKVARGESRESLISTEGEKWEIDMSAPLSKTSSRGVRRPLTKPAVASARMRAVTSPAEKRRPERKPTVDAVVRRTVVPPVTRRGVQSARSQQPSGAPDPVTRQMIDRDTLRVENKALFSRAIAYWRSQQRVEEVQHVASAPSGRMNVYVRKRPLFEKETGVKREYDVVSVLPSPDRIVVHNCLFQADLKTPYLMHSTFSCFTRCFDETAANDEVFSACAEGLVNHAINGGISTIFCFGQTGSGKTFTMTSIQELTSLRLGCAEVQFVELCGKKVLDLLSPDKSSVKLREAGDGRLILDGASTARASSAHELMNLMQTAQDRRNTESTGANDVSSRSHVVGILSLVESGGKLTLVDLAGSERRKDSMWHDRERQKEGAEINASLHALKECIRLTSAKTVGSIGSAFRLSTLTRILAPTFTNPEAQLAVIATVSPCATDVEHTISTLKTVQQLTGTVDGLTETKQTEMYPKPVAAAGALPHPKKWTPDQVQIWLSREGESECLSISKSTTGAMLCRMPETRFIQACGGDERRGTKLFHSLHALMQQRIF